MGWKEISFTLPTNSFRWEYIKNNCLLCVEIDGAKDWFIVNAPKRTNNGKAVSNTVKCAHVCSVLKTKNLYLVLDDENGIGTIEALAATILANTGWKLGHVDTFYERDGETEKIRSLSSSGKRGSYQLIQDLCNLFNAYPVFNGDEKTVDLYTLESKGKLSELTIGKNLSNISVENTSDDIVTRLYVEGEYSEDGYVGIDSENPTGLPYLLNFDYYKNAGLFTEEHQAALDKYLEEMPAANRAISDKMAEIMEGENLLNDLWGQINYVIYKLSGGTVQEMIKGGTVLDGEDEIQPDDALLIFKETGNYREATGADGFAADDVYAIKFITLPAGTIGARQVAIEAKQKMIESLRAEYEKETDEAKKEQIQSQIEAYEGTITDIYGSNGETGYIGLYEAMRTAVELAMEIDGYYKELETLKANQAAIESEFADKMGDMLRDGYWSNSNYAPGQEKLLYYDAVDRMNEVSKPTAKYSIGLVRLPELMGFTEDVPEINDRVRLVDESLGINDIAYVSKRTVYLDDPRRGSIEISNEGIVAATAKNFETVLGKVTQLADMVDQRNTLYERARAINANGTLPADRVVGKMEIQEHTINSSKSNWYTDDSGAFVFENILGDSAFKIGGDGIMIANSKIGTNWDWKLYGSGAGFDASALTSGTIDGDRIANGSVGSSKLSSGVGNDLDISKNLTIADPERGLQAQISASAEKIESVMTATGIGDSYTGDSMMTKILQTAERIETVAQKTGVDSMGNNETLLSKITQTAESIRSEVSKNNGDLMSSINQTASGITAEVTDKLNG